MPASALISVLARSLLTGTPVIEEAHARAVCTMGRRWRWLRPLAERYVARFAGEPRPRLRDVERFLMGDAGFRRACTQHMQELGFVRWLLDTGMMRKQPRPAYKIAVANWLLDPPRMQPVAAARAWDLPVVESLGDLAQWLSLDDGELEWFADLKALACKVDGPKLQHYHYHIRAKRSGGLRLTESPKPRLKELQRRILAEILDRVPVHSAVHGFVKGRSIVSFAAPHVGQPVVLRLDLQDFFPSFPGARVQALFRTLGYPEAVADRLGGICTNAVPRALFQNRPIEIGPAPWRDARTLYTRPHLPQGAPSSPAIANLTAYRLDCRLSAYAQASGGVYTRYADDLAFSGGAEFARGIERFAVHAAAIALEEGFSVNHHKTHIMRQSQRQQLAGVVVNQKVNLRRHDVKLLEAILTNCVRLGPASQNREGVPDFRAHLQGRVGFVAMVSPVQGGRLKSLLEKIEW
jgi:hypothetical protein